ncbi:hypothetical protein AB0D12_37530 [Streptomyces sp. NPDC048479]|uniref:hypothetical protein n=1 Tax=Streptomyces sp. NPDC048479 TaxID=3154725 RepID=UPI00342BAFF6
MGRNDRYGSAYRAVGHVVDVWMAGKGNAGFHQGAEPVRSGGMVLQKSHGPL